MKVLHICVAPSFSNGFGGGIGGYSRYTMRLHELNEEFTENGVKNIFLGVTHPWGWQLRWLEFILRFVIDIFNFTIWFLSTRPDLVHIHGLYWRSLYREVIFVLITRLFGRNILYEARAGDLIKCFKSNLLYRSLLNLIFKLAGVITIQGYKDQKHLQRISPKAKVFVLPNFLSKSFENNVHNVSDRNSKSVAFVGAIGYQKKCDIILKIANARPDYEFNLYGTVDEDFTSEVIPRNVKMHGRIDPSKLGQELQKSTYFIFISTMSGEGQPNALLEAMSIGLIPITIDHGYIREIVPTEIPIYSGNMENMRTLLSFFDSIIKTHFDTKSLTDIQKNRSSIKQLHLLMNVYSIFNPSLKERSKLTCAKN